MKLVISKALDIPGFMSKDELVWLAFLATQCHKIVEIGSYLGRSTRALADNTPGFVLAIDDWFGPRDVNISATSRELLYSRFLKNTDDLIQSEKLIVLRERYERLHEIALNFQPDMVFIDGDHSYLSVRRDILWSLKLLNGKGIICGHDADYKPVLKAVDDSLQFNIDLRTMWWSQMTPYKRYAS